MPRFARMLTELEQIERQSYVDYSPRSPSPVARRPMPKTTQQAQEGAIVVGQKRRRAETEEEQIQPKRPRTFLELLEDHPDLSDELMSHCNSPTFFDVIARFLYQKRQEYPELYKEMGADRHMDVLGKDIQNLQVREEEELSGDHELKEDENDEF